MSDADSFINEVTEEVRREKLFGYLRRYGWVGVVAVLLLVGGAAWNEYRSAQQQNAAQSVGDALLAALSSDDAATRAEAMASVTADGNVAVVTLMLRAATQEEAGNTVEAVQTLDAIVGTAEFPEIYRDLAAFKAALLKTDDAADRRARLDALSQPGQPFRLLALEQLAYLSLEQGDADAALGIMTQINEDAGVTRGLRQRIQTLMVAMGEDLPDTAAQ